ncbi:MAG: 3-phosphoshikimate 1-carboxyvinyltransferase [Eubacterium sp.]|nr:3-phosphoshikimate 1-carboxyvinyltransferase [Eubacterium sp.]
MEKYCVTPIKNKKNLCVSVPGSKSITNRALMLAAISNETCELHGVLFSADSRAFLDCLMTLGFQVSVDEEKATVIVKGENGKIPEDNVTINVESAGTAARFITVLLAVSGGTYTINSSEQMKKRPMKELLDKIKEQGVELEFLEETDHFPFRMKSKGIGMIETEIDTTTSSQYASALLMAAPMNGMKIHLTGSRVNGAYIKITLAMMKQFGIGYKKKENTYEVASQQFGILQYEIEPDMSAACYFYAMALILKTKSIVKGIHMDSLQGDKKFLDVLKELGASVSETSLGVEVDATGLDSYSGITLDMSDFSDQALTLAVVAAFASSKTVIKNIGHIRKQESDRVAVIATELKKIGCDTKIVEEQGQTHVEIVPGSLHGAEIETYEDHRVAMSFAMAGTKVEGITILNPLCCKKTFENYFEILERLTKE